MKWILVVILVNIIQCWTDKRHAPSVGGTRIIETDQLGTGPVIVELFTSEGCSSCPTADRLIAELRDEYQQMAKPVVFMSFHVDYWDRLGWKDQFGNPAFSTRQRAYVEAIGSHQVYTPQVIINGRKERVGSDEGGIRRAIETYLKDRSDLPDTLSLILNNNIIESRNSLRSDTPSIATMYILTSDTFTHVKAGENANRKLKYVETVLYFQAQPTQQYMTFDMPQFYLRNKNNYKLIIIIQDKHMKIKAMGWLI